MRSRSALPPSLLAALLIAPAALAADPAPSPWLVLPWGDGPGEPGLFEGGDERPALGPIAVVAAGDGLVISDPVHRQLLVLDADGRVVDAVPTPFVAVDLAPLADGGLVALDALGDRVHLRAGAGPWRPHPVDGGRLAAVAAGPDGAPWVIDALGRARPVAASPSSPPATERATPLGPGSRHHAAGRRADARGGELLVWAWDRAAEVKPPGPSLRLPVAAADHLLGAIRPLRVDGHGVLHALVERLADAGRVEVHAEVRRYDLGRAGAELDPVRWVVDSLAPVNRYAAVDAAGRVIVMAARPEGLTLWRLPAPVRATAPARDGGAR